MTGRSTTARTTKINRATAPRHNFEHYCRDLNGWPRSWMGLKKDLPPGEKLVARFRPFLKALAASDLSPKTIQKHVDNLWTLGGEIIRDLNEDPSLEKKNIGQILDDRIDDERRPARLRPRIRRISTALLRFYLPEALPLPSPAATLNRTNHPQIPPTRRNNCAWVSTTPLTTLAA